MLAGLDDYPRSSAPHKSERHVDMMCWAIKACDVMARLCERAGGNWSAKAEEYGAQSKFLKRCGRMAYLVTAYVLMAYVLMAHILMAYIVMAYAVMAYIVLARSKRCGRNTGENGKKMLPIGHRRRGCIYRVGMHEPVLKNDRLGKRPPPTVCSAMANACVQASAP